ncbi:hypothetical protein [Spongiactinospora gelatinilytica]|uniref:hypothetical protein n=1 Tax=Spongiactinospora gelatinilytica TaxID=2666298 RepID=UPI001313D921|nr:hypothetical protein [Spongiactinospora gelatinilytica]
MPKRHRERQFSTRRDAEHRGAFGGEHVNRGVPKQALNTSQEIGTAAVLAVLAAIGAAAGGGASSLTNYTVGYVATAGAAALAGLIALAAPARPVGEPSPKSAEKLS